MQLTKTELSLRLVDSFIEHVKAVYPNLDNGADRLVLILRIYRLSLRRRMNPSATRIEILASLKHGIREAELLLEDIWENESQMMAGWLWGIPANNPAQQLANLLWEVVMTLTQEVMAIEAMFPGMRQGFDREREQYRKMKSDSEEALRNE